MPAGNLENGRDIYTMKDIDEITYYQLDLDAFDFIVANGLAVESYRDAGNRHWFENCSGSTRKPKKFAPIGTP